MSLTASLIASIARIAQLQNQSIDNVSLQEATETHKDINDPRKQLAAITHSLTLTGEKWIKNPDQSKLPILYWADNLWGVLRGKNAKGDWVFESFDSESQQWIESAQPLNDEYQFAELNTIKKFLVHDSQVFQMVKEEILSQRKILSEIILASVVINTVALASSFYTLQVYDRVVPTGSSQTLLVLTIGVVFAILYEFVSKKVRGALSLKLVTEIDKKLARNVYNRFLSIRLDQMPRNVGTLAGQIKGYETVRNFLANITSYLIVDLPFALLFCGVIFYIAEQLALIPLCFFILGISLGLFSRKRVMQLSNTIRTTQNKNTGLLVESVEGAETIKSGQAGWRMLGHWLRSTDEARKNDMSLKKISETSQYIIQSSQQLSYVFLIASGALIISQGELTTGGLIACSILSSRILAPVAMVPNQIMQWGQVKSALLGLDQIWALKDDHHGIDKPLVPESIKGHFRFEDVIAKYTDQPALVIPELHIQAGEKIGILGPVGAGKTTLLRALSGMYKPQQGKILLDNMDLCHIAKPLLSEHTAFIQQEARLFAGTLRENLILGLIDPGDEAILAASEQTGLLDNAINTHPEGLHQPIYEGGTGLSGGQKQLVNLTRSFLRKPNIWLLDEPTASMDRALEVKVTQALQDTILDDHTLFLVTHKIEMLALTDRILFVMKNKILLDGPKDEVLKKLQASS